MTEEQIREKLRKDGFNEITDREKLIIHEVFIEATKEPSLNYIAQLEAENRKLNAYNAKLLQSDIDKQNKICLLSAKIQKLEKILVNHPELKEE